MSIRVLHGDCRDVLRTLEDESVHCIVTSPPYFGLRDYGTAKWDGGDPACNHVRMKKEAVLGSSSTLGYPSDGGARRIGTENTYHEAYTTQFRDLCAKCGARRIDSQIGLEATPDAYVAELVGVFRECRRVLRRDGTLWLNLGDSYAANRSYQISQSKHPSHDFGGSNATRVPDGLKPKDLIGIPWMVAFALRADGWYLRQDIVWSKGNTMPESVTDRCCKSHEYVFLLTKSARYYFDHVAIQEDTFDGGQGMQRLSGNSAADQLLQEQSTIRRADSQVRSMHGNRPQSVGSQIQSDTKGQSDSPSLLLFGEGPDSEDRSPEGIRINAGATRSISPGDARSREGAEIQGAPTALRQNREGAGDESEEGQEVLCKRQRAICEAQDRNKAASSNQDSELHADTASMAGDQCSLREPLRLLSEDIPTAGNGSCDPALARREPYCGERRPGVQDVQRNEGEPASGKRNKRSVWAINSQPFSGAHFATMPPALIEPCIKAGTSEKGCCAKCGAPWKRVVEKGEADLAHQRACGGDAAGEYNGTATKDYASAGAQNASEVKARILAGMREKITTGWSPSCSCNAAVVPCLVLDPFGGAGTTALVADRLQRSAIIIELNPAYARMAEDRLAADGGMFTEIEAA